MALKNYYKVMAQGFFKDLYWGEAPVRSKSNESDNSSKLEVFGRRPKTEGFTLTL